MLVRRNRPVHP